MCIWSVCVYRKIKRFYSNDYSFGMCKCTVWLLIVNLWLVILKIGKDNVGLLGKCEVLEI